MFLRNFSHESKLLSDSERRTLICLEGPWDPVIALLITRHWESVLESRIGKQGGEVPSMSTRDLNWSRMSSDAEEGDDSRTSIRPHAR